MVTSFLPGEWVLGRLTDGLAWPGKIIRINEAAMIADIRMVGQEPDLLGNLPDTKSYRIPFRRIYKFPSNVETIMAEMKFRSFIPPGHKWPPDDTSTVYKDTLYYATQDFDADAALQSLSSKESPRRIPVLRTASPPPQSYQGGVMGIYSPTPTIPPKPNQYGILIRDASTPIEKLYVVNDFDSAVKQEIILRQLGEYERLESGAIGLVCERHPQWMFTSKENFKKHWDLIHPRIPRRDPDCEDVDMEGVEELEGPFVDEDEVQFGAEDFQEPDDDGYASGQPQE